MKIIKRISDLRQEIARARSGGKTAGFVPTMGALHDGHISLMRACRKSHGLTVVSIFVNPIQFGPKEDFRRYPRDIKGDAVVCKKAGVDILFLPDAAEMYPRGFRTRVSVEGAGDVLCGKSRPGHFSGVATVVAKLLNIVGPDTLYLGQKDAQQAVILKKMCRDLDIPVKIRVLPTVRDESGLALSSRNAYLSDTERAEALVLYRSLTLARKLIRSGVRDTRSIIRKMTAVINDIPSAKIDYVSIAGLDDLNPLKSINRPCLVAVAVRIGKTRLIDNMVFSNDERRKTNDKWRTS